MSSESYEDETDPRAGKKPLGKGMTMLEIDHLEAQAKMMQKVRDQLVSESKKYIDELEAKMQLKVMHEVEKVEKLFELLKQKNIKTIEEVSVYQNALKDEQDSLSQRLQSC